MTDAEQGSRDVELTGDDEAGLLAGEHQGEQPQQCVLQQRRRLPRPPRQQQLCNLR